MDVVFLKLILLIILGVLGAFCGCLPLKLREHVNMASSRTRVLTYSLISCFAGGVFFAVSFLDVLPEALELHSKVDPREEKFPWVGAIAGLGFLLVQLVEILTTVFCGSSCEHDVKPTIKVIPHVPSGISIDEDSAEKKEVEDSQYNIQGADDIQKIASCLPLFFALSTHSLLEGFAFGVMDTVFSVSSLFFGIAVHKAAVFFSAGVRISQTTSVPMQQVLLVLIMSVAAPLGGTAGILVQNSNIESSTKDPLLLVLNCLSLGTFIHITFFELLAPEYAKRLPRILQLLFTTLGFGLIAAAMAIAPET